MAPKDRTAEFHSALASIRSRTALPSKKGDESKQRLLGDVPGSSSVGVNGVKGKGKGEAGQKSEFGKLAGGIAKDINATTLKLQKLAQRESRPLPWHTTIPPLYVMGPS